MMKMGLPEGSIRNKATQDGCSNEVMDYFFKNCTASGNAASSPAPVPALVPALADSQPAATQVCLRLWVRIPFSALVRLCINRHKQQTLKVTKHIS